jgi:hypothetical protein
MGLDRVEARGRLTRLETERAVVFEINSDESETRLLHGPDDLGSGAPVSQAPGLAHPKLDAGDIAVVPDPELPESKPPERGLRSGDLGEPFQRHLAPYRYT